MTVFHLALLIVAVIAAVLAWRVPHAVFWIVLGAISFVTSAVWQKYGLPGRDIFGSITDAMIIFAIAFYAKQRYELGVALCFIFMILLNVLHFAGLIESNYWHVTALEMANHTAMVIIGITGTLERAGYADPSFAVARSFAGALHRGLYARIGAHPSGR